MERRLLIACKMALTHSGGGLWPLCSPGSRFFSRPAAFAFAVPFKLCEEADFFKPDEEVGLAPFRVGLLLALALGELREPLVGVAGMAPEGPGCPVLAA